MTTLRTREEMDKIPYIKYARYFMSKKRLSFKWPVWFFKFMQKATITCNLYLKLKNGEKKKKGEKGIVKSKVRTQF